LSQSNRSFLIQLTTKKTKIVYNGPFVWDDAGELVPEMYNKSGFH